MLSEENKVLNFLKIFYKNWNWKYIGGYINNFWETYPHCYICNGDYYGFPGICDKCHRQYKIHLLFKILWKDEANHKNKMSFKEFKKRFLIEKLKEA